MEYNNCYNIDHLPDIEMYGGDTLPWEVTLVREDGSPFSFEAASECSAKLTLVPLKATVGIGNNANTLTPVLSKNGVFRETLSNGSIVLFEFTKNDTKLLRGKYLYQIEITRDNDLRVCQGHIYIKQNIRGGLI